MPRSKSSLESEVKVTKSNQICTDQNNAKFKLSLREELLTGTVHP